MYVGWTRLGNSTCHQFKSWIEGRPSRDYLGLTLLCCDTHWYVLWIGLVQPTLRPCSHVCQQVQQPNLVWPVPSPTPELRNRSCSITGEFPNQASSQSQISHVLVGVIAQPDMVNFSPGTHHQVLGTWSKWPIPSKPGLALTQTQLSCEPADTVA